MVNFDKIMIYIQNEIITLKFATRRLYQYPLLYGEARYSILVAIHKKQ